MKRVIRFSIFCILFVLPYIAVGQQYYAWQDTLYVRVADSAFVNNAIEFDLQIYRPNANWEAQDTILGDADFCFNYNEKAFSSSSSLTFGNVHAGLQSGALLGLGGEFIANQWIIIKTVLENPGSTMLPVPLKQWVTLCRVKIGYASAAATSNMPGIVWDEVATGIMTAGGRPVYLKLLGDVKKHPDPIINLTDWSPSIVQECEGEDVLLFATGNSSGDALKFKWDYSKTGQNNSWTNIGAFDGATQGTLTINAKTVKYSILGIGDTIIFHSTAAVLDSMFFRCTLSDLSLPDPTNMERTTPNIQVMLRDSLWGFLANTGGITHTTDTVTKCPSSEEITVSFYLFGFDSNPEYNAEVGSTVHFSYHSVDELLISSPMDTIDLPRTAPSGTGGFTRVDGRVAYFWNVALPVKPNTTIYVDSIWTDYCHNGKAATGYDTLYIKEVDHETYNLAKLTVEPEKTVALTPVPVPFDKIELIQPHKGLCQDLLDQGPDTDENGDSYELWEYFAGTEAGIDTVIYSYAKDGCTMEVHREVEITDNYYLTMRVLLEGPYYGLDNAGKDSMVCVDKGIFDSYTVKNGKYVSPYADSLAARIAEFPVLEGGGTICDWVYIMLRDGMDGPVVDSTSAFLRQDGYVFNMEGKPYVAFSNLDKDSYYIVVSHRHHIPVMSKEAIKLVTTAPAGGAMLPGSDFTKVENIYGMSLPLLKQMLTGVNALYGGDVNGDGVITSTDRSTIKTNTGMGYWYDLDHSMVVVPADVNFSKRNNGRGFQYPAIQ